MSTLQSPVPQQYPGYPPLSQVPQQPPAPPPAPIVPQPAPAPVAPAMPQVATMGQAQQGLRRQQGNVNTAVQEGVQDVALNEKRAEGAIDAEAEAANKFNKEHVAPIRQAQVDLAAEQEKIQAGMEAQRLALQGKMDQLDQHANALALNPISDFYSHQSVAVKATSLLGQMFGGFVQGLYGGDNPVLTQLKQTMDRDLQQQRLNYEYGQQGVTQQRGIYGEMMRLFGDRQAAYHASYLTGLEGLNRRLDLMSAKYGDPKVLAGAEKAKAALAEEAAQHIDKLTQWGQQQATGLEAHSAAVSQSQAQMDNALLLAQANQTGRQELESTKQAGKQLPFAEWDGAAKNNKEYNDLNEVYTNSTDFNNKVGQAISFAKTMNPLDTSQQAVLRGLLANMFSVMRGPAFTATGANLSKNEEDNIMSQLPGLFAGNVAPDYFQKLLTSTARLQAEKTINAFQRRGLRPKQNNMLLQQYMQFNGAE